MGNSIYCLFVSSRMMRRSVIGSHEKFCIPHMEKGIGMNYYQQYWNRYFDFSGRSRRAEFWTVALLNLVAIVVLFIIDSVIIGFPVLSGLFILASIIPNLALQIRRFHDIGRSGWWFLINLVPCVGPIIALVMTLIDSQIGDNMYGPDPKAGQRG